MMDEDAIVLPVERNLEIYSTVLVSGKIVIMTIITRRYQSAHTELALVVICSVGCYA